MYEAEPAQQCEQWRSEIKKKKKQVTTKSLMEMDSDVLFMYSTVRAPWPLAGKLGFSQLKHQAALHKL